MREDFARNLHRALQKRGWMQTELSRHTGIGRDSISHYLAGRNMPGPVNAKRIADALQVPLDQMMPWISSDPVAGDTPEMETKHMPGGRTFISVNKVVGADTALKIITLIRDDEISN
jgi:transcriptional regulator with XRE-family HTH domain